jgi:N-acetylneuraminic acid mutarotase
MIVTAAVGWESLPPVPDRAGVAGAFAGVSGGALLVAGGANFPDKKPWEGGRKVWHDAAYVLDRPAGAWKPAGRLPRPLAYGVTVTHRGAAVGVGGSDARRHWPDCFKLDWNGDRLAATPLPALPRPLANACGALVGDTIYMAGGQEAPDSTAALRTVYALDLAAARPQWREGPPLPGAGRILAVAAACAGSFWVAGGASLSADNGGVKRTYLTDIYRLEPGRGWTRVADLPRPAVGAPSPAPADEHGFFVLGGDDGSNVGFAPPDRHPGFARGVLRFDVKAGAWSEAGEWPTPRVTAPAVEWAGRWVVPSGEVRPGVRSPEVWSFTPNRPR